MSTTRLYRLGYSLRYSGMFGVAIALAEMTSRGVIESLLVTFLLSIVIGGVGWVIARREAKIYGIRDTRLAFGSSSPAESTWRNGLLWWAAMLGFGIFTTIYNVADWVLNDRSLDWFLILLFLVEATIGIIGLALILRDSGTSGKVHTGGEITSERP